MTQVAPIEQLSHIFEQKLPTAPDASYIDALCARWQVPAIQAGFLPLAGVVNVSELPRTYTIHPLEYWHIERISMRELHRFAVPQVACEKLNRAYEASMPVKWLLWAEQHVTPPEVEYRRKTKIRIYSDPALIALIKGGNDIGIPYLVHCWLHE